MINKTEYETIWNNLNNRHKQFIEEYLANGKNASESYRVVYNKTNSKEHQEQCKANGSRLIANDNIKSVIEYKMHKIHEKLEITAEWIQKNLKDIIDGDNKNTDRINALKLLAQMKQFIVEKKEIKIEDKDNSEDLIKDYDNIEQLKAV
jgi:phage terminase small subunit